MPRFFFHVYDDIDSLDEDGLVLADADAAIVEAHSGVRSLAAEQVMKGHLNLDHRVVVADSEGQAIAIITFREAIAVRG